MKSFNSSKYGDDDEEDEYFSPVESHDDDDEFYSPIDSPFKMTPNRNSLRLPRSPRKPVEKLFKIIIIGDPTVGKTSFIQRYVQNTFSKDYKGTIGVDFALKQVQFQDTHFVKLQLWDIAGQERFTWMTRVYYKDAHGCIIMFDLTNKKSFENTLKWKNDLDAKCTLPAGSKVPCMLLANKCDLPNRAIEQSEIEAFHKENNFIGWTETSAKEGLMVNDSMKFLVEVLMQTDKYDMATINRNSLSFHLSQDKEDKKKKCAC